MTKRFVNKDVILGAFHLQKGEEREVSGNFLQIQYSTPGPGSMILMPRCLALMLLFAC